jgi:lipopolysaccharide export system protein LptA
MTSLLGRSLLSLAIASSAFIFSSSLVENAQAQPSKTPELLLRSDIQQEDTETGDVIARGNVSFDYPAAQIQGTAKEARYIKKEQLIVLTGDVRVLQKGEILQGERVTCAIAQGKCTSSEAP